MEKIILSFPELTKRTIRVHWVNYFVTISGIFQNSWHSRGFILPLILYSLKRNIFSTIRSKEGYIFKIQKEEKGWRTNLGNKDHTPFSFLLNYFLQCAMLCVNIVPISFLPFFLKWRVTFIIKRCRASLYSCCFYHFYLNKFQNQGMMFFLHVLHQVADECIFEIDFRICSVLLCTSVSFGS